MKNKIQEFINLYTQKEIDIDFLNNYPSYNGKIKDTFNENDNEMK